MLPIFASCVALLRPLVARADDVDDYVEAQRTNHHVAGLSVAVYKDGALIKSAGYGLADVELGAPATTATVYPIGAISESFAAQLIEKLVLGGKMRWNDPIARYVPGAANAPAAARATLEATLFHAAGFKDPDPRDRLVAEAASKASGTAYATALSVSVLTPLGLTATRVNDPAEIVPNRASGYRHVAGVRRNAVAAPAAPDLGLLSTAGDLAKWAASSGNAVPTTGDQAWRARTAGTHRAWILMGNVAGFRGVVERFVDDHVAVAVCCNDEDFDPRPLAEAIVGVFVEGVSTAAEPAIEDKDPKVTALLRQIVADMALGTATDPRVFTPDLWMVQKQRLPQFAQYRALGTLKSIELLESRDNPEKGFHAYRYRLTYPDHLMIVQMATDKAGLVSALGFRLE